MGYALASLMISGGGSVSVFSTSGDGGGTCKVSDYCLSTSLEFESWFRGSVVLDKLKTSSWDNWLVMGCWTGLLYWDCVFSLKSLSTSAVFCSSCGASSSGPYTTDGYYPSC